MTNQKNSTIMNVGLWITQALVALVLIWGAYAKFFMPLEELLEMMPWAASNPGLAKLTGVVDLLGGLGLILPVLLKIKPGLTVYAAYGTIALMIAGTIFHGIRGEFPMIGMNVIILLMALFIAWGRSRSTTS